jgi:hypothetical protein
MEEFYAAIKIKNEIMCKMLSEIAVKINGQSFFEPPNNLFSSVVD